MSEFTLKSGKILVVGDTPFDESMALHDAILEAMKGIKFSRDMVNADIDFENPFASFIANPGIGEEVINRAIHVMTAPGVKRALFACFARCTYEGVKITPDSFNDREIGAVMRKDYYEICMRVAEVNCLPFFENVFSVLKGLLPMKQSIPAS